MDLLLYAAIAAGGFIVGGFVVHLLLMVAVARGLNW